MKQLTLKQLKIIFIIMLSIFLLASAVSCAWLFLKTGEKNQQAIDLNMAVSKASSIAEILKADSASLKKTAKHICGSEDYVISGNTLTLYYDEKMQTASEYNCSYTAFVTKEKADNFYNIDIKISSQPDKSIIYELEFKISR